MEAPEYPGRGPWQWVLSRALCRYVAFEPVEGVGAARREGAARLKALEGSPYADTGLAFHWGATRVGVWLWDAALVADAIRAQGGVPEATRIVPETALMPPGADGARLVATLDGYETQAWSGGELRASRWWPSPPGQGDWVRFQRVSLPDPALVRTALPEIEHPPFLDAPWAGGSSRAFSLHQVPRWQIAAAVALVALLPPLYELGQIVHLASLRSRVDRRTETLSESGSAVMRARARTLENLDQVGRLMALDPFPSQLTLLVRVAEKLPQNGAHLTSWEFQNGDLRMTVSAAQQLDASFFVRAISEIPVFKDVTADTTSDGRSLTLKMQVVRAVGEGAGS